MCEPTTIAAVGMLAIGALSAVTAQKDANDAAAKQEAAIQDAAAKDRAATARQYEEINKSAMDDQAQRHTEFLIEQARLRVAGGESGLGGVTQDRIEQNAENVANTDMSTLENNRQRQAEAAHTQGLAKSTQAGVQLSGIRRVSNLSTGLQIAGSAASAYSMYNANANKPDPNKGGKP